MKIDCVFCDIVKYQISSWIVYQNEDVICFLPKAPEVYGHTIVAPKRHVVDIYSAPVSALKNVIGICKELAIHYKTQIGASGVNLLHASGASAQQSVLHFHIHLIPRFNNDGINAWPNFPASSLDKDEMLKKLILHK